MLETSGEIVAKTHYQQFGHLLICKIVVKFRLKKDNCNTY